MRVGNSDMASNEAMMKSMILISMVKTYEMYLKTRYSGHYRRLNKLVIVAHEYYGISSEVIGEVFLVGALRASK